MQRNVICIFNCHLIMSSLGACITEKHGTTHASESFNYKVIKILLKKINTLHSYVEKLTKCIITTSGSCDRDFLVLTGTTDPHLTVLF